MRVQQEHIFLWQIIFISIQNVGAKFSHGILSTKDNWHFIDRFCFVSQVGKVKYSFYYPKSYAPQELYLYFDTPDQWKSVYNSRLTCPQKLSVLKPENNQVIVLTNNYATSTCSLVLSETGEQWYNCTGERQFISARERWWYFALGNCNSSQGLYVEYNLTLTNGPKDDYLHHHFSADEFYILPTDMAFLIVENLALLVSIGVAIILRSRQMLHATYKLYLFSILLECLSLYLDVWAGSRFAHDGIGYPLMEYCGQLLRAGSTLIFLLLLILLGKGWTVTRGRLSTSSSWKITAFMLLFAVVYASLYIYQMRAFDPAEVLYVYQSPVGYLIILMRIIAWVWFCYAIYFTLVHYPEKRTFYYRFTFVFSIWFWLGPIVIVCCNEILDNWFREKVANGIENAVVLYGFLAFLFITRPSAANSTFPYHVRTTQIAAINEAADEKNRPDSATDLPHHVYEVRYSADKDEVFTISSRRGLVSANSSMNGSATAHRDHRSLSEEDASEDETNDYNDDRPAIHNVDNNNVLI